LAWGRVSTSILSFNAMAITPFVEYVHKTGLMCKYNYVTDEYEVMTLRWGLIMWDSVVVATVPGHMAHNSHNLDEAKQLIRVGLDLHNCFT